MTTLTLKFKRPPAFHNGLSKVLNCQATICHSPGNYAMRLARKTDSRTLPQSSGTRDTAKYVEESLHMDVDTQPRSGSECFRPRKTKRERSHLFRYGIRELLEVHGWNGAVAEEHLPQANSKRVHVRLHVVRLALNDLESTEKRRV